MRYLLFILIFFTTVIDANDTSTRLPLENSADIQDAVFVDTAMWALSEKVSQCIETKKLSYTECVCLHPKSLHILQMRVKKIVQKHPSWREKILVYTYKHSGHNINIRAIIRHFSDEKMCEGK